MAKRHEFRIGDWESAAIRLDEIISAHSGEDPFEEALKLLVGKLMFELAGESRAPFLSAEGESGVAQELNRLLCLASERWRGVLEAGAATRLSGPELVRCSRLLDSLRLLDDNLVGLDAIFEYVVNKASKGQKGQYFTPRHVIREVVEMMGIRSGERVADPACGSGAFLRHAIVREPDCSVWGFDQDPRAVRVARVMLAASGQAPGRVMRVDSLRRPARQLFPENVPIIEELVRAQESKFKGFDVILTNPPFAGDVGAEYSQSYELASGKHVERDVLFVERCIELLRPGGRLAIVLPHNKVGSDSWTHMRSWLLEQLQVVAILGLGRNTFQPHTSQKACVLFGQKRTKPTRQFRDEEILFFVSEKDGKDHRGRVVLMPDGSGINHDLGEATTLVQGRFAALGTGN